MFLRGQTVVLLPLLAYVVVDLGFACTAVGVTPGASVDGSAFVSHSSDAEGEGDPRVYKVEAKTHKPGTLRPVFDYPPGLSGARKPPIGHIPQVARTHGYLRETYGMMNDKQVYFYIDLQSEIRGEYMRVQAQFKLLDKLDAARERTLSKNSLKEIPHSLDG